MSHVNCHMSHVTCLVPRVKCIFFVFIFCIKKNWCASLWRIWYERGQTRLFSYRPVVAKSSKNWLSQTIRTIKLKFEKMCWTQRVTCKISHVTSFDLNFLNIFFLPLTHVLELVGGGSVINWDYPFYFLKIQYTAILFIIEGEKLVFTNFVLLR